MYSPGAHCLNRPSTSPKAELPFEIVSMIVEILFEHHLSQPKYPEWSFSIASDPFLYSWVTPEFLGLRLVCKTWALAATPICFRTLWFRDSSHAQIMINLMTGPVQALDFSSFVKRLAFQDAGYWKDRNEGDNPMLCDPNSTDEVVDLINLIGQNTTELYLKVHDSIMITSSLVEAVKNIKGLKKLSIEARHDYQPDGGYDSQAFSDLLVAHPNLECLILHGYNLETLSLGETALSKLKHISFIDYFDAINIEGMTQICTLAKHSLKSIEFFSYEVDQGDYSEMIEPLFEPIMNTLEFISCNSIDSEIPQDTIDTEFPRLRVIHMASYGGEIIEGDWPIFHHVRTISQSLDDGQKSWRRTLNQTADVSWKPPNLRLLVFTEPNAISARDEVMDEKLINALKMHGIHCCYYPKIKPDELLELDLRFNGPMK
ncbi:uncharacterized protein MELLADRAFT_100980 [Melampsora larici-populina 98AG31]|uniref:F-box domain-containing protein n=1 Tax=Melampsora larici-populina (strain 98AG31 / pathotype 3-4-7) TaxID=747676 RepID=F4R372_MELLP|nr:uncharacterized protein MELLADRAFT_100980 [Melampsora larici-populina 98AG31]EGG13220.1 hypothetical protein MELLADRAFT_100980 [Melampsora larici-populina 98AG31]